MTFFITIYSVMVMVIMIMILRMDQHSFYPRSSSASYLVGHWHTSKKLVPEHFVFQKDERRDGFVQVAADKSEKLPTAAYEWIVQHYSCSGNNVVDLFSHNVAAIVATMRGGRTGIYFRKEEVQENIRFHLVS